MKNSNRYPFGFVLIYLGVLLLNTSCQKDFDLMVDSAKVDPRMEVKRMWNGEWSCIMDSCCIEYRDTNFQMNIRIGDITQDLYGNSIDDVQIYLKHPEFTESPWKSYVKNDTFLVIGVTPLDYDEKTGWYEYSGFLTQSEGEGRIQIDVSRFGVQHTYTGAIVKIN